MNDFKFKKIAVRYSRNSILLILTANRSHTETTQRMVQKQKTPANRTYTEGSIQFSSKDWFHGELTRGKAEQALKSSGCDCFLIRQSKKKPGLSLIHNGELQHIKIKYGPSGYRLEGALHQTFSELQELVIYYTIPNKFCIPGASCAVETITIMQWYSSSECVLSCCYICSTPYRATGIGSLFHY